jgi:Amt family ammonium transporter
VAIAAGAPFVASWAALALGAAIGLITVLVVFAVDHLLRWDDSTAALTVHGLAGGLGILAVGIFADGRAGAGWNGVGVDAYLGVAAQGVTGLLAAPGFQPDWPGQMQAQLVGLAALALLGFFAAWLCTVPLALLIRLLGMPTGAPTAPLTAEAVEIASIEAPEADDKRWPMDHGPEEALGDPAEAHTSTPAPPPAESARLGRDYTGEGVEAAA